MDGERVAFFYGTLMHPSVLKRVINNDASHCRLCPGLLLDHTRHQVKGCDYPGVIPYSRAETILGRDLEKAQRCVRGTLVYGLTAADIQRLDVFEGDEYTRERVSVHPLSEPEPLPTSSLHTLPSWSTVPPVATLPSAVVAETYVWSSSLEHLSPDIWSYEVFVQEQLHRWIGGSDPDIAHEYRAVDVQRGRNDNETEHFTEGQHSPAFGHALLSSFCFEPGYINLNHGSYGSMPRAVSKATEVLALQIEAKPDLFMRRTYRPLLNQVRERVAKLLNAQTDECVIVPNATHGISTVMLNIDWKEGDVIVGFTTTYGAVSSTIRAISDRPPHPALKIIPLVYPIGNSDLLELFRDAIQTIPRHQGQTVVAIIDGIVSTPGVRMPWEDMVRVCREENLWSVVDGAHLIGQLDVDLTATQPDFWVSNCHKWLMSKRGSAVLYVPRRNQHVIKITLPISIGYVPTDAPWPPSEESQRFVKLFEWTGTIDYAPFLSIAPAMDFRKSIGGEAQINAYCHALALKGGRRLASILGTRVLDETGELTANMANVLLPLSIPENLPRDESYSMLMSLQDKLLDEYNCFAGVYLHDKKWWARCSAQVWNEVSDFEYIGHALLKICADLQSEHNKTAQAKGGVGTVAKEEVVGTQP